METPAVQAENELNARPAADRVRIVSTPGVCGGRPRIDGHRITVEDVAIWHERMGLSPDEIVSSHPGITLSDVHAALAYYFEHRERIDAQIAAGENFVAEMRAQSPSLVQEKLRQRKLQTPETPETPPRS